MDRKRKWRLSQASATLELALLMPMLLAVLILLIYTSVFLYNREAVCIASYMAAMKGAQMEQDGKTKIQAEVEKELHRLVDHRLPFITSVEKSVKVSLTKVQVSVKITQKIPYMGLLDQIGGKSSYEYEVKKAVSRMNPAEFIWNSRRWKRKGQAKEE